MNITQLNLRRPRVGYNHNVARRHVYREVNNLVNPITLTIRMQGRTEMRGFPWTWPE